MSFKLDFGTNYDNEKSELAARVAVFLSIRVRTGFGNTGRVSSVASCVPACSRAGGSLCILWASLRRAFHDVINSVLFELEIDMQLEYVVWEFLLIHCSGKVALNGYE